MQTQQVLAFLILPASFLNGADLSLPTVSSAAGTGVSLSAVLTPGSDSVGSLQFDVQYDGTAMSLAWVPGASTRSAGKTIYSVALGANQTRFLVTGINQNPMPQGDAIDFFINLSANASSGLHTLTISSFTCSDVFGNAVSTTFTNGGVQVTGTGGSRTMPSEVLNAASLTSGPVAPGEILTVFGADIGPAAALQPTSSVTNTVLAETSVLFDGTMAPLLYAGPNQINAIVPFEVSGQTTTNVVIESGGELTGGFSLDVAAAAPAIFTLNSSGSGPGAILNQDLTLNSPSNPALRGSIVVLYATGAGAMNPPLQDGQVVGNTQSNPDLPVSVTIGGVDALVVYSGAAPGLVAGVLQVNCIVPQSISPGSSVGVNLVIGTQSSPPGVELAVR